MAINSQTMHRMWLNYYFPGGPAATEVLLQNKANVNAQNNWKESALLWAAVNGSADVAKILIKHGADVNTHSSHLYSALHWAARSGNSMDLNQKLFFQTNSF